MEKKSEGPTDQKLGKFGFQTPSDVKDFLLSETGKEVQEKIVELVFEEFQKIQREQEQYTSDQDKRTALSIALERAKEKADAKTKMEIEMAQNAFLEKNAKKPEPTPAKIDIKDTIHQLEDEIADLSSRRDKVNEGLEKSKSQYKEERKEINSAIRDFNKSTDKKAHLEQRVSGLNQEKAKLLKEISAEKDELVKKLKAIDPNDKAQFDKLQTEIAAIKIKIDETGHKVNAIDRKIRQCEQLKSVQPGGDRYMCTARGKQVNDPKDAHFFIKNDKQLVKIKNEYYLIDKSKWNNEQNKDEKLKGKAFENLSPTEIAKVFGKLPKADKEQAAKDFKAEEINMLRVDVEAIRRGKGERKQGYIEKNQLEQSIKIAEQKLAEQKQKLEAGIEAPKKVEAPAPKAVSNEETDEPEAWSSLFDKEEPSSLPTPKPGSKKDPEEEHSTDMTPPGKINNPNPMSAMKNQPNINAPQNSGSNELAPPEPQKPRPTRP